MVPLLLQQQPLIGPETGLVLWSIIVIVSLVTFGLWVWSIIWAYRDAERRGKSGVLVALLVAFLSWPLSLVVWLVFRPDAPQRSAASQHSTTRS